MEWTIEQIITSIVSLLALILGVANYIHTRSLSKKENIRQKLEDNLRVDGLIDEIHELLIGTDGYKFTKIASKLNKAEINIRKALNIMPNYYRTIEYEGHLYEAKGNIDAAKEKYIYLISKYPHQSRAYDCLSRISNNDESIKLLQKAIELEPFNSALSCFHLGEKFLKIGRIKEAERFFKKSIETGYPYAHSYLGDALRLRGDINGAHKEYEKAISVNAQDIIPVVKKGLLLMSEGEDDEGKKLLEHAMKMDPDSTYPYEVFAKIYSDRKQASKALEYIDKAMDMDPKLSFEKAELNNLRIVTLNIINTGNRKFKDKDLLTTEDLNKEIVILLKGKNLHNESVFSYVSMPLRKIVDLKDHLDAGTNFKPVDFGKVIEAGRGEPSEELKKRMANEHDLV